MKMEVILLKFCFALLACIGSALAHFKGQGPTLYPRAHYISQVPKTCHSPCLSLPKSAEITSLAYLAFYFVFRRGSLVARFISNPSK